MDDRLREPVDSGESPAARVSHAHLDVLPLPIWRSGIDGENDYFNRAWLEFTGRTLAQELSSAWDEGVHPEDLDRCLSTFRGALRAHVPFDLRYRLRRHDGEYRWVIDFGRPFVDPEGHFAGHIGTLIDETERREKEQQLLSEPTDEELHEPAELADPVLDVDQVVSLLNLRELLDRLPLSGDARVPRLTARSEDVLLGEDDEALPGKLESVMESGDRDLGRSRLRKRRPAPSHGEPVAIVFEDVREPFRRRE